MTNCSNCFCNRVGNRRVDTSSHVVAGWMQSPAEVFVSARSSSRRQQVCLRNEFRKILSLILFFLSTLYYNDICNDNFLDNKKFGENFESGQKLESYISTITRAFVLKRDRICIRDGIERHHRCVVFSAQCVRDNIHALD